LPAFLSPDDNPLVRAVARVPATVNRKLLVAFVSIVALLVTVGVLGIRVLGDSNSRVEALGKLQQRTAAYQKLQTDAVQVRLLLGLRVGASGTDLNNYAGGTPSAAASSFLDATIESTLAQIGPSDLSRLPFVPPAAERAILDRIQSAYTQFLGVSMQILALDGKGNATQAQQVQHDQGEPLSNQLVVLAGQLVNTTTGDTAALIAANTTAYADSEHLFIAVAAATVVLALLLGFILSWSLVVPLKRVNTRLAAIAEGDFSGHVEVPNRDELGVLAANLNRTNEELGRLYRELESASRHKSEFLASMSHELRTPLNAVIGFSEVLLDRLFGDLNEKQADYITDIHTSGRHLLALINDILDLSKIEAGRMELQLGTVVLADVIESPVALMRERATRNGISLRLDVDSSAGAVDADERKLKQVLFNLLTNALKFTDRGGHVEVTARGEDDHVLVTVRDDGTGIALADQARIFEEFEQAGGSGAQEGTGLGLALSRRIVELHGGRLWVESAPGKGSTFTFTVPRAQAIGSASTGAASDASPAVAVARAGSKVT
jgi:signal transduction histidine kinase